MNFISESALAGLTSSEDSRKKIRDCNTLLNMIPAFKDPMNKITAVYYGSPRVKDMRDVHP